jgi:hypothetical protein
MKHFESDFATIEWNSTTKTVQIAYKESSALHNAPSAGLWRNYRRQSLYNDEYRVRPYRKTWQFERYWR